jgi:hypothetical protein
MAYTTGQSKQGEQKIRAEVMAKERAKREKDLFTIDNLAGLDKIDYELGKCESYVKNCKYDLSLSQNQNNPAILHKLKTLNDQINKLKAEREVLLNGTK